VQISKTKESPRNTQLIPPSASKGLSKNKADPTTIHNFPFQTPPPPQKAAVA
jgi:hypothetical protein